MGYEQPGFRVSYPADVAMSTESVWEFAGVSVGAAANITGTGVGGAALQAAGSAVVLGILQNNPIQGEAGDVVVTGISKAIAAATMAIGTLFTFNSVGAIIAATSGTQAYGIVLESCVSGDITTVLLKNYGKQ